jgi:type II secretory pathway pseudopilin PulG
MVLQRKSQKSSSGERGYVLLVITLFAMLLVAAMYTILPKYVFEGQREKEDELIFRGQQYTRAIQLFVRKNGRYPLSLDELQSTNNIRFIRKLYPDPMTKDGEWRLIHVAPGPVFYDALNPPPQPGNGSAGTGNNQRGLGNSGGFGQGTGQNGNSTGNPGGVAGGSAANNAGSNSGGSNSGSAGSQSSSNGQTVGSGGAIAGVASKSEQEAIKVVNGYHHYNEWEFIFNYLSDPIAAKKMAPLANPAQPTPPPPRNPNPPPPK